MTSRGYELTKRVSDVAVASTLLIVTLPIQVVVGVLVRRRLGSPVLFRQPRPGRHGQVFELVKFRTMREEDADSGLVTDAERLTPFGARLRATSLDELPTLWNVVRGEMSLVGPRPLMVQYLDRYSTQQARRHDVRPGITGLAQVSGRNALSWEDKFAKDVEYVGRRSLALDLSILARTVVAVVRHDGISDEASLTMTEFMGERSSERADIDDRSGLV